MEERERPEKLLVEDSIVKVTLPVRLETHRGEGAEVHVARCAILEVEVRGPTKADTLLALREALAKKIRGYTR